MSAHRKDIDETKQISFLIKDDKLLEKYNEIIEKVSKNIKKEFDTKPVYEEKYLKIEIKPYKEKISIKYHNNQILKEDSQCIC